MELWSRFLEIREYVFFKKINWLDCEQYIKNKYLNVTNPLIIRMIFIFLYFCKKPHDNKNSAVKILNLVVSHQSRPVKSNPSYCSVCFLSLSY